MSKMKLSKKWRKSAFVVAVMAVVAAAGLAVGHVLREVREGQTAKDVQLGRSLVHQPHLGQGDGGNMLSTKSFAVFSSNKTNPSPVALSWLTSQQYTPRASYFLRNFLLPKSSKR
jgi:hypothetical protein